MCVGVHVHTYTAGWLNLINGAVIVHPRGKILGELSTPINRKLNSFLFQVWLPWDCMYHNNQCQVGLWRISGNTQLYPMF